MRVPAALHRWAAEHNRHLSATTRSEVDVIASIIEASSLRDHQVENLGPDFFDGLYGLFPEDRADRAETLIEIVAQWVAQLPAESSRTTVAELRGRPTTNPPEGIQAASGMPTDRPAEIGAPAFLRSDKIDEDDTARLYGSARSYIRLVLAALSVLALVAVGVGVWFWANSRSTETVAVDDEQVETPEGTEPATDGAEALPEEVAPTPVPTPTPVPELPADRPSWADTTTILNTGSGTIASSTYPVSAANRAVLTGHTGPLTGIAISDDGRVLTSGADRRLVDWGADVTLASPDVLDVDHPLTALTRTADQKIVAGDAAGNITVIDLINATEPNVVAVHSSAVSAIVETTDARLAVASADGEVALLALAAPGDALILPHGVEVTALVALPDGGLATAAVDGLIRIWPATGGTPTATIEAAGGPITSMIQLSDGQLAVGTVGGSILIIPLADGATPTISIAGAHAGSVRALFEFDSDQGGRTLASGGEDTTIRLFSLETGRQWQQLDGHGDLVSAISQLPDGRLVSTSADSTGRVWDLSLLGAAIVSPPHAWNLAYVAPFRNDQVVTAGVDGFVTLSSTSPPTTPSILTRHDAPLVGLTVMPNGDIVSLDATSILRLIQVGPEAAEPIEVQLAPGATALDDRGGLGVVTGHGDGTVRFSDFTTEVGSIQAHTGGINAVVGLTGGLVASAGDDQTVRILDFGDPDTIRVFDLHTEPVEALIELPDGRIASAGSDAIYIWSVDDMGQEHVRLNGHRARTLTLLGLPDGRLLSSAADGRVRMWDLDDPSAESTTVVDVPGIVNPVVAQAENGLFVAGAGRGYVVFTID